jgi:DNA-binding CsgD family transcriptional regulator
MQAQQLFLRRPDGRLGLPWPADEHGLHEALHQFGIRQRATPFVMQVHDAHGGLTGTLKACPVAPFAGPCWSEPQAHAIVFVKSLSPATDVPMPELLRQQWRFTAAEARLALALVRGATLDEAGEMLGVRKNTVRTQLRVLFDKTDTHRQAELLRVLLKLTHT